MSDDSAAEYHGLRATIRERGTLRICVVIVGLIAMSALAVALSAAQLSGAVALLPLLVLAATFEINFFVHTGVERIGRYLQVFHEERAGTPGWETAAMNYGAKYASRLDPLFSRLFAAAATLNFLATLAGAHEPGWMAVSLAGHLAFAYRIVTARALASSQRALDLDRFRGMLSK
jgi:4-hydroxybenzoate polyprenyltransferase